MTLGQAGVAGDGPEVFNRPSDALVAQNGSIFVADGHGGDSNARILKFDREGKFIKTWGEDERHEHDAVKRGPAHLDRTATVE
jgi:hypothetical protein